MKKNHPIKLMLAASAVSLVLTFFSLFGSVASMKAQEIKKWHAERVEKAREPFIDPSASEDAISWAKEMDVKIQVQTGISLRWWTVFTGLGDATASCVIRVAGAHPATFLTADGFSQVGSQKQACSVALAEMKRFLTKG